LWNRRVFPSVDYQWHPGGYYDTAGSQEGGIEFTRSVCDGTVLRAGRLWTEPSSTRFFKLDGTLRDTHAKKAYDRWVNRLFSWIRNGYVKYSQLFYIGPGAAVFQEMGGMLRAMHAEMDDPSKIERRYF
jgi:hypothetical protein